MAPEEQNKPGIGNSVNAEKSVSSGIQQTPEYGAASVKGSRKAAGRAEAEHKDRGDDTPRQATLSGAPETDARRTKSEAPDSGTIQSDQNDNENRQEKNSEISEFMKTEFSHIKGWGIDANPENDPAYPMRKRKPGPPAKSWKRPPMQAASVELLFSTERNNRPAVFGTAVPPSGLSGALRRRAFRYSESDYRHWLGLMLADRINVVEGVLSDFRHGRIPNPIAERGLPAEWKYNRKAFVRKAGITLGVISAVAAAAILLRRSKKKGILSEWVFF